MPHLTPSIRSGMLYFAFFAAMAALLPFMVLYFERIGLSGREIGVLSGLVPAFTVFAAPLWSAVADARGWTRRLLVLAALGAAGAAVLVPTTSAFVPLLGIVAALAFFAAPLAGLIDTAVLAMLGAARSRYGRIRSWGAVGWGLSAPLVGLLTESAGLAWAFFAFGMLMTLTAGIGSSMPAAATGVDDRGASSGSGGEGTSDTSATSGTSARHERAAWLAHVRLFANGTWAPFLFAAFAGGIAMSGTSTFLYLRFAELGADESLVGLAITVATISEVPVFVATGWLLRRWRSQTLLLTALAVFVVRLVAYGLLASPVAIVAIQLLHGASFALLWTAGVHRAAELAPGGRSATSQGVFNATVMGLGAMVGALLGGVLYDALGSRGMFLAFAALVLVAAIPAAWRTVRASAEGAARTG